MVRMNAKELRVSSVDPAVKKQILRNPVYIICDDVLDTYNVGSIFRLADAVAATRVILCGQTLTPPNSRIKKASVNTWQWVDWEYMDSAADAIDALRSRVPDIRIICVEQNERSVPFDSISYPFPVAIIVGNETHGVSEAALTRADTIVEIPMWGINRSLNVMVSCGIVLFEIMKHVRAK